MHTVGIIYIYVVSNYDVCSIRVFWLNFAGHVGTVYGLAVIETPGNIRLVSASYDKTLRVSINLLQFIEDQLGMLIFHRYGISST